MEIITKRDRIRTVPSRWYDQYQPFSCDNYRLGDLKLFKKEIYDQLLKLNLETVAEEDITKLVGNPSWTSMQCDECHEEVDILIRLGNEEIDICPKCLAKAVGMMLEKV